LLLRGNSILLVTGFCVLSLHGVYLEWGMKSVMSVPLAGLVRLKRRWDYRNDKGSWNW